MVLGSVGEFGEYPLQLWKDDYVTVAGKSSSKNNVARRLSISASGHRIYIVLSSHQFSLKQSTNSTQRRGGSDVC